MGNNKSKLVPADLNKFLNVWKKTIKNFPDISYLGSDDLRKKCKNVVITDSKTQKDIKKLKEIFLGYREKTGFGRGLAAPQIGVLKRFVAVFVRDKVMILVNPRITKRSNELTIAEELCVSMGNLAATVVRPKFVSISYQDETGKELIIDGNDKESRVIQHELDHLDGILNIDKAIRNGLRFVYDIKQFEMNDFDLNSKCPCGSDKKYIDCCGK
ncbi:MAG: peptide deformylase [Candidatus Berkelbacteria bacterium]